MEAVLLVIHLIVALSIICVVLIQPSEAGGFLGSGGSMSNMMAPRRSADVLTRVTAILAVCFFVTSLLLAVLASHRPVKASILDAAAPTTTEAPAQVDTKTEPKAKSTKTPEAPKPPVSK